MNNKRDLDTELRLVLDGDNKAERQRVINWVDDLISQAKKQGMKEAISRMKEKFQYLFIEPNRWGKMGQQFKEVEEELTNKKPNNVDIDNKDVNLTNNRFSCTVCGHNKSIRCTRKGFNGLICRKCRYLNTTNKDTQSPNTNNKGIE